MNSMEEFFGNMSVWIGFNLDSPAVFLIVSVVILTCVVLIGVAAIYLSKARAGQELASYGSCRRPLTSFVCAICLHRSYAVTHIKQRYCVKCDRFYPDKAQIGTFAAAAPVDRAPREVTAGYSAQVEARASVPALRIDESSRAQSIDHIARHQLRDHVPRAPGRAW